MPRKCPSRWKDIRKDRQKDKRMERPYFKTILATTGVPTGATAVDWHLKVKDIVRCWSNKKLLHHSQHTKK